MGAVGGGGEQTQERRLPGVGDFWAQAIKKSSRWVFREWPEIEGKPLPVVMALGPSSCPTLTLESGLQRGRT